LLFFPHYIPGVKLGFSARFITVFSISIFFFSGFIAFNFLFCACLSTGTISGCSSGFIFIKNKKKECFLYFFIMDQRQNAQAQFDALNEPQDVPMDNNPPQAPQRTVAEELQLLQQVFTNALGQNFQQLTAQMNTVLADNHNLRAEVQQIRQQLVPNVQPVPAPAAAAANPIQAPTKIKTKDPDTYTGKPGGLRSYINQINFAVEARAITDERQKILFAASCLRGSAETWAQTAINTPGGPATLAAFLAGLHGIYGDPNEAQTGETDLLALTQTGPLAYYVSDFLRLSLPVRLPEHFLLTLFRRGLKPHLRNALAAVSPLPTTLPDLIQLATSLEGNLQTSQPASRLYNNNP
jgi:hypothetical protein